MAVAVEMNFKGATLDQYEQVIEKMGFTHGGKGAPHGLFHWVAQTDDGIRVVDVWDSNGGVRAVCAGADRAQRGRGGDPSASRSHVYRVRQLPHRRLGQRSSGAG